MKLFLIIGLFFLLSSCSISSNKNEVIESLNEIIQDQQKKIADLKKKEEIRNKIEKYKILTQKRKEDKLKNEILDLKNQISNGTEEKEELILDKEKELDIKFYSQFPLDISTGKKYDEPYQNFCEESSLLNGYYYLIGKEPDLKEYDKDLLKLKELEDLLFEGGYKHTNLEETLQLLIAFQGDNQEIFGEIIENPTIEDIKKNIFHGNPVIIMV